MKTNRTIDVWINPEGGITIDAVGFSGSDCEAATAFLEEALGNVGRRQRSRDYYRKEKINHRNLNQQKGGA